MSAADSLHSLRELSHLDVASLSQLHPATHDLIAHPPRHPNLVIRSIKWWGSWAIPGMGMFSEAYIVFSIGNILPLLAISYPNCFGKAEPSDCNTSAKAQDSNVEICGIIGGMLVLGFMADWIGRKWGSRTTMMIMLIGGIMLSSAAGSASAFLTVFLVGLFIFGFGVGGEYPMASSSAAERAEGKVWSSL